MASTLDALYYPFSRCMNASTLKQYLLLFDSITFLDPVDDDDWRGNLYQNLEDKHRSYLAYRDVAEAMPWLRGEGVVRVRSPAALRATNDDLTVAATLSDLSDDNWVAAADPRRFKLATTFFGSAPSWHVFRPKIPRRVEEALVGQADMKRHLLQRGGEHSSWQVSYAAGSALSINVHLAAANELGLAPVTDSSLHHELMLRKLVRNQDRLASISDFAAITDVVTQRTVFNVINEILPAKQLAKLTLEDVLEFRKQTAHLRQDFVDDVGRTVDEKIETGRIGETERTVASVTNSLVETARKHGVEMAATRDKLWPKLIEGVTGAIPVGTSLGGLAASYITNSGYVLAASVVLHALSPLKAGLEWRAERNKARAARSAIAYLSRVQQLQDTLVTVR